MMDTNTKIQEYLGDMQNDNVCGQSYIGKTVSNIDDNYLGYTAR